MKALVSVIVCLMLAGCATHFGQGWSKADTAREIIWEGLHVVDWGQTRYIAKHPDKFYEINPLIGKHPSTSKVDIYMAGTTLLHPVVSGYLKPEYRKWFQYITIGISGGCVINNASIGVKVGW